MSCDSQAERARGRIYGALAFGSVMVAAYGQFAFSRRIEMSVRAFTWTFVLGAIYAAFSLLRDEWAESDDWRKKTAYFVVVSGLATAILYITRIRGYFFFLTLPIVAQAIFDLGTRAAALVTAYLFALCIGLIGWFYGRDSMFDAGLGYATAFAFAIVFTIITRQAIRGRRAAEALATTVERNRLAREIHDGVGHYLTVIKVQLDAASALLPADPARAADSVAKAARLAGEALDDVRRSVGTLAADAARPPLIDLLRSLTNEMASAATLRIEGTPRALGASAEHALFRTAQEGLTNVRKHSAATEVILTLDFRAAARVRLQLADNGRGVAATDTPAIDGSGYGLRGLRERIALLGGTLDAGNRPEGGFTLAVEVPA